MSAYFMKRKTINAWNDCKAFYVSRLKRFWFPFLLSATSLYVIGAVVHKPWFNSPLNFLLSLFGLSVFKGPLPSTLWFMVMMMFLYFLTPLWLAVKKKSVQLFMAVALMVALWMMNKNGWCDSRLLYYVPMYFAGLLLPNECLDYIEARKWLLLLLSLSVFIGFVYFAGETLSTTMMWLLEVIGAAMFFSLSSILSESSIVKQIASVVSYSSMNMYLFHRQIYLFFLFALNIGMFPNFHDATIPLWISLIIVIPSIILSSFLMQRVYDKMLKKLNKIL